MVRNVIEIDEDLCIGCGLCATACMQGAIEIIDGKAKLVSESYCDGLGMCLPKCPVDAIHVVEKETEAFKEERKNIKAQNSQPAHSMESGCGCSGSAAKTIERPTMVTLDSMAVAPPLGMTVNKKVAVESVNAEVFTIPSELMQWPVQLKLVSPNAPYFQNADLLIAADCTAFAYGDFHRDFIKDKVTIIGCPKLDDNQYNTDKIAQILSANTVKSITVVKMEVPCCNGMIQAVRSAMLKAQCIVPYSEVTISTDGRIK